MKPVQGVDATATVLLQVPPDNDKCVLRPPKAQTEGPEQAPQRENPRRKKNRDRYKDK